ncbi:hypothetical protein R1sor_007853 [Riccia sorocarpa]|uniref:Integrase catalytic domain-containing protein n=1 Tax=Riccia sorocarpa TaxID=122646 RepID=A0ABD3HRP6_9MARC
MPFGLSNAPATFQRLVIDTFAEYIEDFMEAFLDDFTVYGDADQHLQQVEKALIKCLENQICLNPEKCVFWVQFGVLLGHIICSEGILMDPGKVEKIWKQPAPTNRKELQRVMGMANFYRRYILNYAVLAAPVNALNRENVVFNWTSQCQEAFDLLKEKLSQGPILRPPNWNMIFHVHTDASGVAVGAVLAQPQDPKIYLPIYFASRTLNNSEKDYTTTEREALAMVYAVKKFKSYLQVNKFVFFVDHQALTYIVNKVHITGRIARWLLLLQEFDFTVVYKPGKINILADQLSRIEMGREIEHEDDSFPDEYLLNINLERPDDHISSRDETDDTERGETYEELLKRGWQTPMRYLLTRGSLPKDTPYHIKRKLVQKSSQYTLIEGELYKKGIDQVLRRCVNDEDVPRILEEAHEGPSGGHGAGESTAQKILHTGLWWPTIFKDCHSHVRTCNECQRSATLKEGMPLKPIFPLGVFQKWGLDFIGPIKPASFPTGKRYIITATDYTTKWVEAECYRTNDKKVIAKFIYENIITRFGVPVELVSDQGGHFLNGVIEELTTHYQVKHRLSTPYYPQCNGQAESTNKILIVALKKLVERHPVNWDASVPSVLWAMRTAYKATTNHTPFHMVYGVEALVPMEFIVPTLRIATEYNLNPEGILQRRLKELLKLEESREQAFSHQCAVQERRKRYIDKHRKMFNFKKDDKVLHCVTTGKIKRRKLKYIWEGPYTVLEVLENGNICIEGEDKSHIRIVNGNKLRPYGVNKFARGDPFVEQVEDMIRDMDHTPEDHWPDDTEDYQIELTPKDKYTVKCFSMMREERNPPEWKEKEKQEAEGFKRLNKWKLSKVFYHWKDYTMGFLPKRNSEGEEIPFKQGEKISNRARRWREAKQAKETHLLEMSQYRIEVPPISKNLSKYPGEKYPPIWKRPRKGKWRMNDVRRKYKIEASKIFYAWKDYALSLERMRFPFSINPKAEEVLSNRKISFGNETKRLEEKRPANRESLWEKYYFGKVPAASKYPKHYPEDKKLLPNQDIHYGDRTRMMKGKRPMKDDDTYRMNEDHSYRMGTPLASTSWRHPDVNLYSISLMDIQYSEEEEAQPDEKVFQSLKIESSRGVNSLPEECMLASIYYPYSEEVHFQEKQSELFFYIPNEEKEKRNEYPMTRDILNRKWYFEREEYHIKAYRMAGVTSYRIDGEIPNRMVGAAEEFRRPLNPKSRKRPEVVVPFEERKNTQRPAEPGDLTKDSTILSRKFERDSKVSEEKGGGNERGFLGNAKAERAISERTRIGSSDIRVLKRGVEAFVDDCINASSERVISAGRKRPDVGKFRVNRTVEQEPVAEFQGQCDYSAAIRVNTHEGASSDIIAMGRSRASSKIESLEDDVSQTGFAVVVGEKEVLGQRTIGFYNKELETIEWEDEERATYWLQQFRALTAMKLTHIEPDLVVELVNVYNPVTDRITLSNRQEVLSEDMLADVFQLQNEGVLVPKSPVLPPEWIDYCYPEYSIPEKGRKKYYAAVRCVDAEWRNRISWVIRFVLGRAEGREISKGVLAAMIRAEEEGQTVNWAAAMFDRIRGELRRLKGIRKGDFLRTEAGPQLRMIAEYIVTEWELDPIKKAVKKIPATQSAEISPSGRTRATKRKEAGVMAAPATKKPRKVTNWRKLIQTAESGETETDSPSSDRSKKSVEAGTPSVNQAQAPNIVEVEITQAATRSNLPSGFQKPIVAKLTYEQALELAEQFLVIKRTQARETSMVTLSAGSRPISEQGNSVITSQAVVEGSTNVSPALPSRGSAESNKNPILTGEGSGTSPQVIPLTEEVTPEIQEAVQEAVTVARAFLAHHDQRTAELIIPTPGAIQTESTAVTEAVIVTKKSVTIKETDQEEVLTGAPKGVNQITPVDNQLEETRETQLQAEPVVTEGLSNLTTPGVSELGQQSESTENVLKVTADKLPEFQTPTGGNAYEQELARLLKGKTPAGSELVDVRAMNAGFSDAFKPWDFYACAVKEPTLHMNELNRGDPSREPVGKQDKHSRRVLQEKDELLTAQRERVSKAGTINNIPMFGQFHTTQLPPAGFEQVGYLRALENRGYSEWLQNNSRTRAAEALNALLPEYREKWLRLTQFGNAMITASTGVYSLMEELYTAYDLINWYKKSTEKHLDELAECQKRFNVQFTYNMELGMILQQAYELLGKADPEGKLIPEFRQRIQNGQAQLERDEEHWFRPRWADTYPERWTQQPDANLHGSEPVAGVRTEPRVSPRPREAVTPEETTPPEAVQSRPGSMPPPPDRVKPTGE